MQEVRFVEGRGSPGTSLHMVIYLQKSPQQLEFPRETEVDANSKKIVFLLGQATLEEQSVAQAELYCKKTIRTAREHMSLSVMSLYVQSCEIGIEEVTKATGMKNLNMMK